MKRSAWIGGLAGIALLLVDASGAENTPKKSGVRINLDELEAKAAAAPKPAAPAVSPIPADTPKASAPAAASTATKPVSATPAAKAAPAQPPQPEPGVEIPRGEKGFLRIAIQDGKFRLSFYDKFREPIMADVLSAALRWPVKYQPNDERALLTPTEAGMALGSEKIVRPPYAFKLFITLNKDPDANQTPESYVIDFR
ncbi:hypothetical protein [Opitutus sp. ER46]|uniref:hypothetical protein n=1 Tax=Opitutus sp. ER46 TaxID=2161864 RepID=UPI000D300B5A|nr:hypothetical protein [Opitutus sp. ER46]PTX91800.1 hypothetical protein DB354_18260 [Opitutus sp. ER46]